MRSEEGKVEILFEVKSKERRVGKLFWKVLQENEITLLKLHCLVITSKVLGAETLLEGAGSECSDLLLIIK